VVHLLQLAERVRVQIPAAGEQMQLVQQLGRLLGEELAPDLGRFDLLSQS